MHSSYSGLSDVGWSITEVLVELKMYNQLYDLAEHEQHW